VKTRYKDQEKERGGTEKNRVAAKEKEKNHTYYIKREKGRSRRRCAHWRDDGPQGNMDCETTSEKPIPMLLSRLDHEKRKGKSTSTGRGGGRSILAQRGRGKGSIIFLEELISLGRGKGEERLW